MYGLTPQNSRGQWLAGWADIQKFRLANTFFKKHSQNIATYTNPSGRVYQLDYILVNSRLARYLKDAYASNCVDLGSDHKAV
eukprot:7092683-Karenia_brevis.AAC.1